MHLGEVLLDFLADNAEVTYGDVRLVELPLAALALEYRLHELRIGLRIMLCESAGRSLDAVAEHQYQLLLCLGLHTVVAEGGGV